MTNDLHEPHGSYRYPHLERRLRMENPYGDREKHDHSDSRDRGDFRHADERETGRHTWRYRDDDYRGESRRTDDAYLAGHEQRGYDRYSSRSGYGRQGYGDGYGETRRYGYRMRNEASQRFDESERGWHRQNDRGGHQYYRGRHQDSYGQNEQDYRGYGRDYDPNHYEEDRGRYDARYPRSDSGYSRERNNGWDGGGGGHVAQDHGWDQHYGSRHDRHSGGYPPRGSGRQNYHHKEADYGRYGRRNDMDIDHYARSSKPYADKRYGDGGRSAQGNGRNEEYDERSATGAQSPVAHNDTDPMLKGEYMFGYAELPPQIWEDVPTDHGTSESDDGEATSDRPTAGMRRKMNELDLEDRPERVKRVRREEDSFHDEK